MGIFESKDHRDEAEEGDPLDDALWEVLGRARKVEVSPYFARRVRQAIAAEDESAGTFQTWWQGVLRAFAPAAICAGLTVTALMGLGTGTPARSVAVSNPDLEFETIQNLDLLVSNYESSIWLDPSSSSR